VASVGVAAHICAASPGGPRFDPMMISAERTSIENGIWLCAAHAVLIDRDVARFPVDVLRAWKSQHEAYVREHAGKEGPRRAEIKLGGNRISDAAARIAMARARGWEYKLLNQMLRDEISALQNAVRDLRYRIRTQPVRSIRLRALVAELRRTNELAESLVNLITQLLGPALADAIGPPGVAGDPEAIAYVARRLGDAYKSVVDNGVQWLHTSCDWDVDNAIANMATRYLSGFASAIEGLPGQIDRAIDVASARDGEGRARVEIAVQIEIPQELADALCAQLGKITKFVSAHGWPDDE